MRWDEIQELPCSVARTMSVIGDRWTMLIIRDCFLGTRRFDDFQKQIGMTRHILSDRLDRLVNDGILSKVPYQDKPQRFEYRLTPKGIDLYPIVMTIVQWGNKYMTPDGDDVPTEYVHLTCGQVAEGTIVCSECGEPIHPRQMNARATPTLEAYLDQNPAMRDTVAYQFILRDSSGE